MKISCECWLRCICINMGIDPKYPCFGVYRLHSGNAANSLGMITAKNYWVLPLEQTLLGRLLEVVTGLENVVPIPLTRAMPVHYVFVLSWIAFSICNLHHLFCDTPFAFQVCQPLLLKEPSRCKVGATALLSPSEGEAQYMNRTMLSREATPQRAIDWLCLHWDYLILH